MQPCRIITALPRACRPIATVPARSLSTHIPHFLSSDFAPLWRVLDDSLRLQSAVTPTRQSPRIFHPRFDVREAAGTYELHGELPGIRQEDLDIQFVDPHTLVVKGHTESEASLQAPEPGNAAAAAAPAPASASEASSYSKPTVEDDYVDASVSESSAPATPTSSASTAIIAAETAQVQEPEYKYWVTERSAGEFTRTFQFPGTVDQEAVKASLRNGILRVVVPKLVRGERRIVVE